MEEIQTFIFIDLKTTGKPKEELNKTKITELSIIAVKRSHVLATKQGGTPRVQQKLTLCLNPRRVVHPSSTKFTRLCNYQLEHEPSFNITVFDTINSFLRLQSTPACLVAFNGINYDFPILKRHLADLNVSFPDDILCADALYCFYDIDKMPTGMSSEVKLEDNKHLEGNISFEEKIRNIKVENETTPKKIHSDCINNISNCRKRKMNTNTKEKPKVARQIFYEGDVKPQKSYKLNDVYYRYLNRWQTNSHMAEGDCHMLLECSVAKADQFVSWVDQNCCRFADIRAMTVGIPLGF